VPPGVGATGCCAHVHELAIVVVMLVLNAGPKDVVVQLTIHPIVLKAILI